MGRVVSEARLRADGRTSSAVRFRTVEEKAAEEGQGSETQAVEPDRRRLRKRHFWTVQLRLPPSSSAAAASPRLVQLAKDPDFCYGESGSVLDHTGVKKSLGAAKLTAKQLEVLGILKVANVASSGVGLAEVHDPTTHAHTPAESLSSPLVQSIFENAAGDVERWVAQQGPGELPPDVRCAPAALVEGSDIVLSIQDLQVLLTEGSFAGSDRGLAEPAWTTEWYTAHGPIINSLFGLLALASPEEQPLKLVEVKDAHTRKALWSLVQPDLLLYAGDDVVGLIEVKNRSQVDLARATERRISPLDAAVAPGSRWRELDRHLVYQLFAQAALVDVQCTSVLADYGNVFVPVELQAGHLSFAAEGVAAFLDPSIVSDSSAPAQTKFTTADPPANIITSIVAWALYARSKHVRAKPFNRQIWTEEVLEVIELLPAKFRETARSAALEQQTKRGVRGAEGDADGREPKRQRIAVSDPGGENGPRAADDGSTQSGDVLGSFLYVKLLPFSQGRHFDLYQGSHSSRLSEPEPERVPQPYLRSCAPADAVSVVVKVLREEGESPWLDQEWPEAREREELEAVARHEAAAYAALASLHGVVIPRLFGPYAPLKLRLKPNAVDALILEDVGESLATLQPSPEAPAALVRAAVLEAYRQLHALATHGDVALCNMMWSKEQQKVFLVDFEDAEWQVQGGPPDGVACRREMDEALAELDDSQWRAA